MNRSSAGKTKTEMRAMRPASQTSVMTQPLPSPVTAAATSDNGVPPPLKMMAGKRLAMSTPAPIASSIATLGPQVRREIRVGSCRAAVRLPAGAVTSTVSDCAMGPPPRLEGRNLNQPLPRQMGHESAASAAPAVLRGPDPPRPGPRAHQTWRLVETERCSVRRHLKVPVQPIGYFVPISGHVGQRLFCSRHLVGPELRKPDVECRPVALGSRDAEVRQLERVVVIIEVGLGVLLGILRVPTLGDIVVDIAGAVRLRNLVAPTRVNSVRAARRVEPLLRLGGHQRQEIVDQVGALGPLHDHTRP